MTSPFIGGFLHELEKNALSTQGIIDMARRGVIQRGYKPSPHGMMESFHEIDRPTIKARLKDISQEIYTKKIQPGGPSLATPKTAAMGHGRSPMIRTNAAFHPLPPEFARPAAFNHASEAAAKARQAAIEKMPPGKVRDILTNKEATSVGGIVKALGVRFPGWEGQNVTHAEMLSRDIPTGTFAHKDLLGKIKSVQASRLYDKEMARLGE